LTNAVSQGGWSLADRVIPHFAEQKAIDWRIAASEPVLVGVLSTKNAQERLDWIRENRIYYHPLPKGPKHRHFYVKQVALFSPKTLTPNGITHVANVRTIEISNRGDIDTPWNSHGPMNERFIVYHLDEIRPLENPIENKGDHTTTFRSDRWTSRLGLERAQVAAEMILETEPEWKLYEAMISASNNTKIAGGARRIDLLEPSSPAGRAWLMIGEEHRIRFNGSNRFLVRHNSGSELHFTLEEVIQKFAP
jgi:hypothetical protein